MATSEIILIIVVLVLLVNSIRIDNYSQNINIIYNRSELNQFYKYSQQQFKQIVKDTKLVECSSKFYCEYWCNPNKRQGKYILDPYKMKKYEGKSLQYGIDIHEYDFPIIIPNGYIEKRHIYIDLGNFNDNLKFIFDKLINIINK